MIATQHNSFSIEYNTRLSGFLVASQLILSVLAERSRLFNKLARSVEVPNTSIMGIMLWRIALF